jgi:16S rRNA (guanine527-N7)-methyltransferase
LLFISENNSVPRETSAGKQLNDEELWLHTILKKNGIPITVIQLQQLQAYKEQLLHWNKRINLVSRRDQENLWRAHIFMSLTILFKFDFRFNVRILDLGTGGGLPGIPLSIMLPKVEFVLLDSIQKKITAVSSMISALHVSNASAVCGRAEDLQRDTSMQKSFNSVIARAVSNLSDLIKHGYPFLMAGQKETDSANLDANDSQADRLVLKKPSLVAFKGGNLSEELAVARRFFPKLFIHSIPLTFKGSEEFSNSDRHFVIVQ